MTLTHRLALAAMFAGAAAFAQGSGDATSKTGTSNAPSSTMSGTTSGSKSTATGSGSVGTDATGTRAGTADTSATSGSTASKSYSSSATSMTPTGVLSMIQQVDKDEIRLGQMAQSKASSDKVKDYAKDMVKDHEALDKKVSDLATQNKLTLAPSHIPADRRTELTNMVQDAERRLGSATGAQFDREYMQAMSSSHAAVLSHLDAALPSLKASKSQDKVYDLAKMARDKVEDHKKHADDVLRDISAVGGSGTPSSVGGGAPGSTTGTRDLSTTPAPGSTGSTGTTTSPSTPPSGR